MEKGTMKRKSDSSEHTVKKKKTKSEKLAYVFKYPDNGAPTSALFAQDLSEVVISCLRDDYVTVSRPRWFKCLKCKRSIIVLVKGLTAQNMTSNSISFAQRENFNNIFKKKFAILCSVKEFIEEVSLTSIIISDVSGLVKNDNNLDLTLKRCRRPEVYFQRFLADDKEEEFSAYPNKFILNETFSRTKLLLTPVDMRNYKVPFRIPGLYSEYNSYTFSKESYYKASAYSRLFVFDIENTTSPIRLSLLDEKLGKIFDTLIDNNEDRTEENYRGRFKDIDSEQIQFAAKDIKAVRKELTNILPPSGILCGHDINNDMRALEMLHIYLCDTAILYNYSGDLEKPALKKLTLEHLGLKIQEKETERHSSVEDSKATLMLVEKKLANGLDYGNILLKPGSPELTLPIGSVAMYLSETICTDLRHCIEEIVKEVDSNKEVSTEKITIEDIHGTPDMDELLLFRARKNELVVTQFEFDNQSDYQIDLDVLKIIELCCDTWSSLVPGDRLFIVFPDENNGSPGALYISDIKG